jgi:hypothetical protein
MKISGPKRDEGSDNLEYYKIKKFMIYTCPSDSEIC